MNYPPLYDVPLLTHHERRRMDAPVQVLSILAVGFLLAYALWLGTPEERTRIGVLVLVAVVYGSVQYAWVMPRVEHRPRLGLIAAASHGIMLGLAHAWLPVLGRIMIVLGVYFAMLVYLGAGYGRRAMYIFVGAFMLMVGILLRPGMVPFPVSGYLAFVGVSGMGAGEVLMHFRRLMKEHLHRMHASHYVARAVSTTIEPHEVVTLLGITIQKVLAADTYFVALLEGEDLRLEILYDEGQFYPPVTLDSHSGLAGWVLQHRKSLFLKDVPQEIERLGIQRRIVGAQRTSLSWMGAPMEAAGHLVGLVAVGSYRRGVFSQADLELLENIASQAAQAIVNARQHAQVREQARRDSLTGVYNHGYFLQRLEEIAEISRRSGRSMGLVMLDIDHFKRYNDTYGHRMGDMVLRALVQTIRTHIKHSDVVGRWGGEEFAILLPDTTGAQTLLVARRIQDTMRTMRLHTPEGTPIPAPTVSQGVALFPAERQDIYALVDLADRRLYVAKARGRDQVEPSDAGAFAA